VEENQRGRSRQCHSNWLRDRQAATCSSSCRDVSETIPEVLVPGVNEAELGVPDCYGLAAGEPVYRLQRRHHAAATARPARDGSAGTRPSESLMFQADRPDMRGSAVTAVSVDPSSGGAEAA
jgi:hypothetical protein